MELIAAAAIPLLFLFLGTAFLVIGQITGAYQHRLHVIRQAAARRLLGGYVASLETADLVLYARARQLARATRQLRLSNDELTRLSGMKSRLLSMVAHDLRNPLSAIRGFAKVLSERLPQGEERQYAAHIGSAAGQIEGLLHDLTDLALLEGGKLRVEPKPGDLRDVARQLEPAYRLLARDKGLAFAVGLPPEAVPARFDAARLGRAAANLLGNAVKFAPSGGEVALEVEARGGWAVLRVRDSGPGVHASEKAKIFEKFYQSPRNAEAAQGWGLGLSIAQELVRLHGGSIGVESEGPGRGATFWIRIPALR